jgi:DNA-binding NarL/FixJ family response regulator
MSAMTAMRVVLVEDEVLLREGMASLLERSGIEVVGQAGDAIQLLSLVGDTSPDLVVIDIRMPPTRTREGLEAARLIREQHPDIGILVLSAHTEVEHAMELLATGRGIGYLLKSRVTDVTEFLDTLERIAKGGSVVDPALVQELLTARRRIDPLDVPEPHCSTPLSRLSTANQRRACTPVHCSPSSRDCSPRILQTGSPRSGPGWRCWTSSSRSEVVIRQLSD